MRHRLTLAVTLLVAAAHWAIIFSPMPWSALPATFAADAPERLATVWITPPVPAPRVPSALAAPAAPVAPIAPAKKTVVRPARPVPVPPPQKAVQSLPAVAWAETETETETQAEAEAEADEILADPTLVSAPEAAPAAATSTPPTGPHLQVHDAHGNAVSVALAADGAALAQNLLMRYRVHGWVKGMEYHAHAELAWQVEGGHYAARQSISAFLLGSMEQTSSGQITAQGLQPLQFSDRRFAKRRHVQFDWQAQQARFDPVREAAPIGPGAQDRLSVFMQLAAMLQSMPALRAPGTRIEIPTLGSRRLQMWTFVVEQAETLELPAGTLATLRLQRQPQPGDDETALLWVIPAQGYVPARIRMQERNGDVLDLSLKP